MFLTGTVFLVESSEGFLAMSSDEEQETRDASLRKLDAENAIGVLATLIAGFSLAMIPAVEAQEDCAIGENGIRFIMYAHVLLLAGVSFCSAASVIYTTGLYFKGQKLLSKRLSKTVLSSQQADFDRFWDAQKDNRGWFRNLFLVSIPCFLMAVAFSPTVWCADAGLGAMLLLAIVMSALYIVKVMKMMFRD